MAKGSAWEMLHPGTRFSGLFGSNLCRNLGVYSSCWHRCAPLHASIPTRHGGKAAKNAISCSRRICKHGDVSSLINPVHLKHILRQVQANRRKWYGRPLVQVVANTPGVAHQGRYEWGRPSHCSAEPVVSAWGPDCGKTQELEIFRGHSTPPRTLIVE